jgi:hypothetical protein
MSALSNYAENKLVDHLLGTASYTMPSAVYMAFYSSNPADDNSGSELSGNGYARQEITFGAASGGSATNSSAETFTASGGAWSTATHFALFDASSSGNLLTYGALSAGITLTDGQSHTFAIGTITVTGS